MILVQTGFSGTEKKGKSSFHRNVYVSGAEYIFSSTDPGNGPLPIEVSMVRRIRHGLPEQRSLLRQFPHWQDFVRKNYVCNR